MTGNAGHAQLQLRTDMDVHFDLSDPVQQVAAGLLGLPLPHRPDVMAHAVLLGRWLPVRARLQGRQVAQHDGAHLRAPRAANRCVVCILPSHTCPQTQHATRSFTLAGSHGALSTHPSPCRIFRQPHALAQPNSPEKGHDSVLLAQDSCTQPASGCPTRRTCISRCRSSK